ncbi:hypothetical protein PDG61_17090 [Mycolicibacterium sp. BiH015]|uniref:Ig-like domain-containing protein n=1 Tax=Mycolicibacterium sp. BiH015 TaxID=3018808 RepID=UPI0022DFD226|nr:hypothetical protein [Mycolicibacterium sp. BiH015]MDA2892639.1 hypothetical protein [Mycolicibacterium sp. BiH015]
MNAGRHVGRIGELAAILGVGIGLSLTAPTAWADDGSAHSSSESSDQNSSTSDDAPSVDSDSRRADEPTRTRSTKSRGEADDNVADSDPDDNTESVDIGPSQTVDEELTDDQPDDDVESPVNWVVAAAARREIGVDAAAAEAENQAPSIAEVTVGIPGGTGTVTGKIVASDADGDRLRYSGTATDGTVTVNSYTGAIRYRPTATARHAAAAETDPVTQATLVVTVDDRQGGVVSTKVLVPISPKNSAPFLFTSTRSPDSTSGVVMSRLSGIDFDGDVLQYSAPTTTSKGAITLVAATRTLVYVPTAAAREAAAAAGAPSAAKSDTFTVTVTDGHGGIANKTVTVRISPKTTSGSIVGKGVSLIGVATVPGYAEHQEYSAAGSHSVIVSDATDYSTDSSTVKVIVVDNATARQVGTTLSLNGVAMGPPLFNENRTRAAVYTNAGGETRIAVLNTTTGKVVGAFTHAGYPTPSLSPSGERVILTSTTPGSPGVSVKVIDTGSGGQIGSTLALDLPTSTEPAITWNADGTRALISAQIGDWDNGFHTFAQVIDTRTGATTADRFNVDGSSSYGNILFNAAGTRAVLITADADHSGLATTKVVGIDMVLGKQIGATLTVPGTLNSALMTADGGRVVITTWPDSTAPQPYWSSVAVVDIDTGNQIGATLALSGHASATELNSTTTRAVVTHQDITGTKTAVTMVDTATSQQFGATAVLDGGLSGTVSNFVNVDGVYALIATHSGDAAILNTVTGARTSLAVAGEVFNFRLAGTDGSRAVITTRDSRNGSILIAVFDTVTGAQIGSTQSVAGQDHVALMVNGNRTLITTGERNLWTGAERTRIAVIDSTDSELVTGAVTLPGELYDAHLLSPGGSRALITVSIWNPLSYSATTKLYVFDIPTGKQIGGAISLSGEISVPPTFSPDGTRVVLTTANPVPLTGKTAGRVAVLRVR